MVDVRLRSDVKTRRGTGKRGERRMLACMGVGVDSDADCAHNRPHLSFLQARQCTVGIAPSEANVPHA